VFPFAKGILDHSEQKSFPRSTWKNLQVLFQDNIKEPVFFAQKLVNGHGYSMSFHNRITVIWLLPV
jgi:hypothetical protein